MIKLNKQGFKKGILLDISFQSYFINHNFNNDDKL